MNASFPVASDRVSLDQHYHAPTPQTTGALVTGGARRIGGAIARDLAAAGWCVAIHYNGSRKDAESLREEIGDTGGRAEILQADLSREEDAQSLVARSADLIGPVGLLVNNASIFEWDDLESADAASWARHMDINLRAPLLLSQGFAANLPGNQGGVIINLLDSRVLNPTPRHLTYTLSKSGFWTLTQTLAKALAPRVRVNAIGPGPTLPPRGQTDEQFRARCGRLPLKTPASLEEICGALHFLVSARSVTGQMIALDGGDHLVGFQPAS